MNCDAADSDKRSNTDILASLDEASRAELQTLGFSISYKKDDLIFQEGAFSTGLYYIRAGYVKYGKFCGSHQHQRLLKILGPGDPLGMELLFGRPGCACPGFARALSDEVQVVFLEREPMLTFLTSHPRLLMQFCQRMVDELVIFECKLMEVAYTPMITNLARLLLILARRFGQSDEKGWHLLPGLGRFDLAELLGTHRDSMSRLVRQLQDEGVILARRQKLFVTDMARLSQLAEPETSCAKYALF